MSQHRRANVPAAGIAAKAVVAAAQARPWADQDWGRRLVAGFPDRLRGALDRWQLRVEGLHLDGAGLPVLVVRRPDGEPGVLKFDGAGTDLAALVPALRAAAGRAYVRLLDHDEGHGAVLLEHLGPALASQVPDEAEQVRLIAAVLPQAWDAVSPALPAHPEPARKATDLGELVRQARDQGLADDAVLARAAGLADELATSPGPRQVMVHGDAHALNVLRRGPHEAPQWVLIDPDGPVGGCEAEYDVGVVLRDQQRTIAALDDRFGPGAGRRWHRRLVEATAADVGLDAERVAAWAYLERVTTGIWLRRLGHDSEGEVWLSSATRL